jgi:hypothetical protein
VKPAFDNRTSYTETCAPDPLTSSLWLTLRRVPAEPLNQIYES